jgi:hypothetical protein
MIKKVTEILNAWLIAANPSQPQIKLASERLKICNSCKFIAYKEKTGNPYCTDCGCPLKKKIFSQKHDACPQHYWLEVENSDIFKNTQKNNKTFL